jgi:hypothetical protein
MLAGWITVIFLCLFSFLVTRRIKLIPNRVQAVFESILGWVYDLCVSVAGPRRAALLSYCLLHFPLVGFNAGCPDSRLRLYRAYQVSRPAENAIVETIPATAEEEAPGSPDRGEGIRIRP